MTVNKKELKRFRIFAGPNGSGKSTIIKKVRESSHEGHNIDCGIYVNADDITVALDKGLFNFSEFELSFASVSEFRSYAISSGLIRGEFTIEKFDSCFILENNAIKMVDITYKEVIAQILSNFIIEQLINKGLKCSMETVFSHESKIKLLQLAQSNGYKVYVYFVATEDPEINKERVLARVTKGGHDVPPITIENRYYRSLELLYAAAQLAYRCYFFDNSGSEREKTVTHFKLIDTSKNWDNTDIDAIPEWFVKYYINKRMPYNKQ